VKLERKSREFPKFMSNFEILAIQGYNYWFRTEHYDIDKTRLYNPNDRSDSITFEQIDKISEEFLV
jgi:hypothetical protein